MGQDNLASAPKWYLNWIANIHGKHVLQEYHYIGKIHDAYVEQYGLRIAYVKARIEIKNSSLPRYSVQIPTLIMLKLYILLPQSLKDLYFKLITQTKR